MRFPGVFLTIEGKKKAPGPASALSVRNGFSELAGHLLKRGRRVSPETEGAIHYLVNQRASTAVSNGRGPVHVLATHHPVTSIFVVWLFIDTVCIIVVSSDWEPLGVLRGERITSCDARTKDESDPSNCAERERKRAVSPGGGLPETRSLEASHR